MRPLFLTFLGSTLLALACAACGSTSDSAQAFHADQTPLSTAACPGVHLETARVKACTEPYRIRHGRPCDSGGPKKVCPSVDLLHGDCLCDSGSWSCEAPMLPEGYDPYPDCPDEGVERGAACYLESSTCLPASVAACFTSEVPLCTCTGHSWSCE